MTFAFENLFVHEGSSKSDSIGLLCFVWGDEGHTFVGDFDLIAKSCDLFGALSMSVCLRRLNGETTVFATIPGISRRDAVPLLSYLAWMACDADHVRRAKDIRCLGKKRSLGPTADVRCFDCYVRCLAHHDWTRESIMASRRALSRLQLGLGLVDLPPRLVRVTGPALDVAP